MQTIHTFTDGDIDVKLEQAANGEFRVTYGADITVTRDYSEAAQTYGYCVFHSLACAGKLNNEGV